MPPALDRLLASPSALRLLRFLVTGAELPVAYSGTTKCSDCTAPRRGYHSLRKKTPLVRFADKSHHGEEKGAGKNGRGNLDNFPWIAPTHVGNEHPNSASLWAQYLQHRERLHGLRGIREAWEARRNFDLPIRDTPDARYLWATFIKAHDLVLPVISHAADLLEKTGKTYPHLYELCMSYWLPQEPWTAHVLDFHHQFLLHLKPSTLPLRTLARLGKERFTPKIYETFMVMYRTSNERNVYDEVVPALCVKGYVTMAQHWHTECTQRGDLPSPKLASEPAIQALAASISNPSDPEAGLFNIYVNSMKQGKPRLNEDLLRRLESRDIAHMRFDDSFCARMFATRTFPPESIIKGLAMVGVNEVGPLAVRTMASRATDISELPSLFDQLKEAGVTLQGGVFSLALEKFAKEGRWSLVRSILESDQHPEVYDDSKLQNELLSFYLKEGDLKQAHRTLAILSLFYNDASKKAWNLLLQAQIKRFAPRKVLSILQTMREKEVGVNRVTLMMIKELLRPRQRGHKPGRSVRGRFDDLRYVTGIWMTILEGGLGPIGPVAWSEILRRYGMINRLRELRRIVLRLFCWYAPRTDERFVNLPKSPFLDPATDRLRNRTRHLIRPSYYQLPATLAQNHKLCPPYYDFPATLTQSHECHPLRRLFPPSFLQGLIVWGFRRGLLPNAPTEQSLLSNVATKKHYRRRFIERGIIQRLDWSAGLRLVVELRDLGLEVHPHTVIKPLQMMFIVLFGHGQSNVVENRILARANTKPYAEYVQEVNQIWGTPIFKDPQQWGTQKMDRLAWHPRFARQVRRRQDLSLDEIIGTSWRESEDGT